MVRLYPLTQSHSPSLANERLCISLGEGVFGEMVKRIPEIVTIGGRTDVVGTDLTATIALILVGDLIVVFANPLREALHCTRVVIEELEERRDVCTVGTLELTEAGVTVPELLHEGAEVFGAGEAGVLEVLPGDHETTIPQTPHGFTAVFVPSSSGEGTMINPNT